MRQLAYAALPLGEGRILDPFMGGGSTIAAAEAVGYTSVGIEVDSHYYELAKNAIPGLAGLYGSAQVTLQIQIRGDAALAPDDDNCAADTANEHGKKALRTLFG